MDKDTNYCGWNVIAGIFCALWDEEGHRMTIILKAVFLQEGICRIKKHKIPSILL